MDEHLRDARNKDPGSHMETQRTLAHPEHPPGEDLFSVKVVSMAKSALYTPDFRGSLDR